MEMTLEKIRMENFKGAKQLTVEFSPARTEIRGANGTGKTTIVDAFCWVLFNSNAAGDAPGSDNFREKPLDENGEVIHNLDTTVELFCTLDGQRFDLKRTQAENWVKKRGNPEATFQGNVSTYWINGVETKQADFKQRIKAIADDEVFRLVGSLSAFNQLEWKKRRAQLLALADSDVDGELLATDEYRPIADEIGMRNVSVDDLRKVLSDDIKAIKNELKMLPVRIDEAKKATPDVSDRDVKDAEYSIAEATQSLETVDGQIADAMAQNSQDGNRGQMLALEQEILSIKRRLMDEHAAEQRKLNAAVLDSSDVHSRAKMAVLNEERIAGNIRSAIESLSKQRDSLREKFMAVKRTAIQASDTCPTCGQPLPQDKVQEAQDKLDADKRQRLADIQTDGKAIAAEITANEAKLAEADAELAALRDRVQAAQTALDAAQAAFDGFPKDVDFSADSRLSGLEAQLEALKADSGTGSDQKVRELRERKAELQARIDRNKEVVLRRGVALESQKRITQYEERQKELGARLSETELLIGLVEKFITDRCGALEESINSHFPTVRWKLFDTQINGGITDVCTCMIDCDGAMVPYNSANTASQINADVEIVNVLSEKYGVRVPLFLDNAERLVHIQDVHTQLISLKVAPCKLAADGGDIKREA